MLPEYPQTSAELMRWRWAQIEPYYTALASQPLKPANLGTWLAGWSRLRALLAETYNRLYVAITSNTTDEEAAAQYNRFLEEIFPHSQAAEQVLKQKLLSSGLEPEGFTVPLQNMRSEASLFRAENLPLLADELKLAAEYDRITGAQTVLWEGEERTLAQLQPIAQDPDRELRERAWRLAARRQLEDRQAIGALWGRFMALRGNLATQAGLSDYRAYRWQQLLRHAYTPEDCKRFHAAIEKVAVPAAGRIYERRRQRLGVERLRPWDLDVDPLGRPPLRPFERVEELVEKAAAIFHQVDSQLGEYFEVMRRERLLDLDNRKGKAPGGYCIDFPAARRPYIFMNAVGLHEDVQTILHEAGHAFHVFESAGLPYHHQLEAGLEMMEVASTAMELLAAPSLVSSQGGFYTRQEAARARVEFLAKTILFWPYMAVVDAFQHWAYENQAAASHPANCDARWAELWQRYLPGVDWSGLEEERATGWQRKLHIHQAPFYYVEYGMAALGALQVWRNSLADQAGALAAYRRALALGGTLPLPQLYETAGAKFAFDIETLAEAVALAEETILDLENVSAANDTVS